VPIANILRLITTISSNVDLFQTGALGNGKLV